MVLRRIADEFRSSMRGFFGAWGALIVAMPLGYLVCTGLEIFDIKIERPRDITVSQVELVNFVLGALALVFCIFIGPAILLFRRFIVRRSFPFFRPGYLAIAACGALVPLIPWPLLDQADPRDVIIFGYEVPVFIGALIYAWLAGRWGGFANERARPAGHNGTA